MLSRRNDTLVGCVSIRLKITFTGLHDALYSILYMDENIIMTIRRKFHAIRSVLDERARRRWAASVSGHK